MAKYEVSESLRDIAEKVIEENENLRHLAFELDRILFMYSDKNKISRGKTVYADTELVKPKYREVMTYDFIITVYKPPTQYLSDEQMERLMYHELRHVGVEYTGDGEDDVKLSIVPHDVEDFREIINSWGIDWL
jgi:hypothetical protein